MVGRPLQNLFAIYAGLEPESFIELFPYWVVQEDITDMQIDVRSCSLFKVSQKKFFLKIGILVNSHFLWIGIPMNWFHAEDRNHNSLAKWEDALIIVHLVPTAGRYSL